MARPKLNKAVARISLRLSVELLTRLDQRIAEMAAATGLDVARGNAVRAAIEAWLEATNGWAGLKAKR